MVTLKPALALLAAAALCPGAGAVTLNGRVVDSQRQLSYAAARVSAAAEQSVRSDGQGFFQLTGIAPGPLLLTVVLPEGEGFRVRLRIPQGEAYYVELDRARHTTPAEDDEY